MTDPQIQAKRPLSPHLQVYRLPYNALMSISGRIVGIGLAAAMVVVCAWFVAIVFNPSVYDQTQSLINMPFVKYVFLVWVFLIFFYIGNGIRHFLWHINVGVNEKSGIISGNIVLVLSALLTAGLWALSCDCMKSYADSETKITSEAGRE